MTTDQASSASSALADSGPALIVSNMDVTYRVRGQDQSRSGVGGFQNAAQAADDHSQASGSPAQPGCALEPLRGRGGVHLPLDVGQQCLGSVAQEQAQRFVQAPTVQIGVQVAQTR